MGGVYFHNGFSGSTYRYAGTEHVPADLPSSADVVLRSSEAVARQTVDIKRIWKGEIVLQNVPIDRVPGTKP